MNTVDSGMEEFYEGRNTKSFLKIAVSVCLVAMALVLLLSCGDDDCPVCPDPNQKIPPYKGWIYTTAGWSDVAFFMIDAETGKPYDSIYKENVEDMTAGNIDVSSDGLYLAVSFCCDRSGEQPTGKTRIFDAQTLEELHVFPFIFKPMFDEEHGLLIGVSRDTVRTFSVPGFQVLTVDTLKLLRSPIIVGRNTLIYSVYEHATDSLVAYNYIRREVVKTWGVATEGGGPVFIRQFDINPDGDRIYFRGGDTTDIFTMLGDFDLVKGEVTFLYRQFYGDLGGITVSPDGREVYAVDPGGVLQPFPTPGTIYIFNAEDGSYLTGISLFGYGSSPGIPLPANQIAFAPTGGYAYITSGRFDKGDGTVLTVDTHERRIINLTWPELGHITRYLVVGPKM